MKGVNINTGVFTLVILDVNWRIGIGQLTLPLCICNVCFFFFNCGKKLCKPTFKFMGRLHFWELHKLERKSVLLARV